MQTPRQVLLLSSLVIVATGCPADDFAPIDGTTGGDGTTTSSSTATPTTTSSSSTTSPSTTDVADSSDSSDSTDSSDSSDSSDSTDSSDSSSTSVDPTEDTSSGEDSSSSTTGPTCLADEVICDGACIDPDTDTQYCGATGDCMGDNAGVVCGDAEQCTEGACECTDAEAVVCDGACIDPSTDQFFCGASGDCAGDNAGVACAPSAACDEGACVDTCDNCGFESSDFTAWDVQDLATPFYPIEVTLAGSTPEQFGFFTSAPTEGLYSSNHGFDGDGGGDVSTIELGQEITLTADEPAQLVFDYRAAWDLATYGATLDRTFEVYIEPQGGGVPLQTELITTLTAGTSNFDSGDLVGTVDLTDHAGSIVYVRFVFTVSESYSGPAFVQLDNIRIIGQ
jgi:hypothetical protein